MEILKMKLTTKTLKRLIKEELSKILNENVLVERLGAEDFEKGIAFTGIAGGDVRERRIDKGQYLQVTPVMKDGKYMATYRRFNNDDVLNYARKTGGMPSIPGVKDEKKGEFYPAGQFFAMAAKDKKFMQNVRSIDMSEMYGLLTLEDMIKIGVPMDSALMDLAKQKKLPMSEAK